MSILCLLSFEDWLKEWLLLVAIQLLSLPVIANSNMVAVVAAVLLLLHHWMMGGVCGCFDAVAGFCYSCNGVMSVFVVVLELLMLLLSLLLSLVMAKVVVLYRLQTQLFFHIAVPLLLLSLSRKLGYRIYL